MGFGMGGRGALPDKFEEQYHCYSAAMADKSHLEVSLFVVCFPLATGLMLRYDWPCGCHRCRMR